MARRIVTRRESLVLILILAVGAALRLYGLNWDGGHWLHPDERQIYFITLELGWPDSLAQALSPSSPLNPQFFAYGSLPFYLLKLVVALLSPLWPALRDPDNLHLAGRSLAVLSDLGTVTLTYHLALALWAPPGSEARPAEGATEHELQGEVHEGALLAAALVGLAVLHVQLAHFYTVDPLLTFFVMLTLYLAARVAQGDGRQYRIGLGVALGLALATKTSAAPLLLVPLVAYSTRLGHHTLTDKPDNLRLAVLSTLGRPLVLTLLVAGAVFVIVQPYAIIDWQRFLEHTLRESQIAWGALDVPYTRQYAGTLPYVYSMWQTALWGLVLPAGLLVWTGLVMALVRWLRRSPWTDRLLLAWAGPYLAITGLLHTRYLRYMLPLLPVLCLLSVRLILDLRRRQSPGTSHSSPVVHSLLSNLVGLSLAILSLLYVFAFVTIYTSPHTWVTASEWIYREAPSGSTLAVEDWDVALPLPLDVDGKARRIEEYDLRVLTLYDEPDDAAKWENLATDLSDSDYLVIASRRLYGSIPRLPDRYPVTTRYYEQLFAGNLGFEPVQVFTRGPTWLNPRIPPLPDAVPSLLRPDESFVVYDHPRTLIFRNAERLSADELCQRLDVR